MASKTRQKSCISCATAKRRCNLQLPTCSRCESRRLPCEYKSIPRDVEGRTPTPVQDSSEMIMDSAPLDLSFSAPQDPLSMYSITDIPMSLPATETMQPEEEDTLSPDFFTAYNATLITTPQIGLMDRPRIVHIVRHLRTYPTQLYLTGKTPFIHPNAYKPLVPPPLQDAICISALYANKNTQNEEMLWDIITSKASLLLAPQSLTSWPISSHLSSLQALIILQIIRLFDGDICQRSLAEDVQPTLEEWTNRLAARTGVSSISSAESMVQNSWESWVFQEMLCRTIIISRMVQAMFSIQKQGYCTLVEAVTEMSFTARKGFWDASSGAHWERLSRDTNSLKVVRMNFGELEKMRFGDVDELALLMLVTYKGVDGVNEWILKMGGDELIE